MQADGLLACHQAVGKPHPRLAARLAQGTCSAKSLESARTVTFLFSAALANRPTTRVTLPYLCRASRCPPLRELDPTARNLHQPRAPLPHLTRLSLSSCYSSYSPLPRLAGLAPRLAALHVEGKSASGEMAEAAAGHPALRDLSVDLYGDDVPGEGEPAWRAVPQKLPALSRLNLWVHAQMFWPTEDDEEEEGGGGLAELSGVQCACDCLRNCKGLTHLAFAVGGLDSGPGTLRELLAAVGAAVGGQLRSLTLAGAEVPPQGAAAEALRALARCFPRLEVLALQLRRPEADARSAEAVSHDVLAPVPALARRCPALQEVWVEAWPALVEAREGAGGCRGGTSPLTAYKRLHGCVQGCSEARKAPAQDCMPEVPADGLMDQRLGPPSLGRFVIGCWLTASGVRALAPEACPAPGLQDLLAPAAAVGASGGGTRQRHRRRSQLTYVAWLEGLGSHVPCVIVPLMQQVLHTVLAELAGGLWVGFQGSGHTQ